jgi:hypothetical protein
MTVERGQPNRDALKLKQRKVVAAASYIAAGAQVKYEKYDPFIPTSLASFGTHC